MKSRVRVWIIAGAAALVLASCVTSVGQTRSSESPPVPATAAQTQAFQSWAAGFRGRALGAGIDAGVFDRAFAGAGFRPDVIEKDRNQGEFNRTLRQYIGSAVTDIRISEGRRLLAANAALFDRIEATYGVDREVVAAIWGMESDYGRDRGAIPVASALGTLAVDGRRGRFAEEQLVAALRIVQRGDVSAERLTGSWAGAMGHTQFIPTSFLSLAVDFTGDGRRDIWSDDPSDALASTANYLARSGWRRGQPVLVEVRLPPGFNTAQAQRSNTRLPSAWAAAGVRAADGSAIPDHGPAAILLPEGATGPAFMVFRNFRAVERYNAADAYVIGVGHLADRLAGGGPFRTVWPEGERALTDAERRELQRLLVAQGYDTGGIDGRIGSGTIAAIRDWQARQGMAVDGFASLALLAALRGR